ncbi:MAG: hypothetical protein P1V19_08100 [Gimesia sp.]|nr:hypothetical protein [Gimesia sp.]
MVKLRGHAPSALSEGPPLLTNPQQPPIVSSNPIAAEVDIPFLGLTS